MCCWEGLPLLVLDSVFNRLEKNQVPDVRAVCRRWKDALGSSRLQLGIHLPPPDDSGAELPGPDAAASGREALANICPGVKDLTILRRRSHGMQGLNVHIVMSLPCLTALRLTPAVRDDELQGLNALRGLASLRLGGDRIANLVTDKGIAHLSCIQSLTSLDVSSCPQVTDAGIALLHSLKALATLDISRTSVTGSCFSVSHPLGGSGLGPMSISPKEQLQQACPFPNLSELNLSECRELLDPAQVMSSLQSCKRLTRIKLARQTRANASDIGFIDTLATSRRIEGPATATLSANGQLLLRDIRRLLASLPILGELDLSGWAIIAAPEDARNPAARQGSWLLNLLRCSTSLEALCLSRALVAMPLTGSSPAGTQAPSTGTARQRPLAPLLQLNLSRFLEVRDSDMAALRLLAGTLTSLNLSYAGKLTNRGLASLAALTSLRSLVLSGCEQITYQGLEALQPLSKLQELSLSSCPRMTDAGLEAVAAMASLESLNCSCCDNITDYGLLALHQPGAAPCLGTLRLVACDNITEKAVRQFNAARPDVVLRV